jgi:DNA-binding MurR/RpiR family transcriptional regulator
VTQGTTVRDLLTSGEVSLTRAERRVAGALLANYPTAGLATVAQLAGEAKVSDPTVVRLVSKLGYEGYAAFQRALLREVESRMRSPLAMLPDRRRQLRRRDLYGRFMRNAGDGIEAAMGLVLPADFEAAVDLLTDPRRRVNCVGGRFSRFLAAMLRAHLCQLRRHTAVIDGTYSDMIDSLVEIDRHDVVVVFDYRRYQEDVVAFAGEAHEAGAAIVLMTDPWKSPIAAFADVTLIAPVEVLSPYDTMVPAMAQVEALVAACVARLADRARGRLRRLEALRRRHRITMDARHAPSARRRVAESAS